MTKAKKPTYEIRYQSGHFGRSKKVERALDEVVATKPKHLHLEQMNDNHWWMQVVAADGTTITVTFYTKRGSGRIHARAETGL